MFSKKVFAKVLGISLAIAATSAEALDAGGLKLGVGPKLALNFNKADIGNRGSARFGSGWGVGAYSLLDLEIVAFELGLQYSERRFSFKDLLGVSGEFAATLKQIEIPLLAYYKLSLGEALALRAGAGAQFDFAVGKVKGDSGSLEYSTAGISKNQISLLFDIGGDYLLTGLGTLTVDLRYALGLKDRAEGVATLFGDKFKTQYVELGVGFLF